MTENTKLVIDEAGSRAAEQQLVGIVPSDCIPTLVNAVVGAYLTAAARNAIKAEHQPDHRDDPLGHFLSQCMVDEIGHTEKARDMYGAYLDWCRDQDLPPFGEIYFRRALAEEGFQRAEDCPSAYRDVRLKGKPGGEDE
ncbi:virus D5 protein-like [Faunimonas pinastri]|uniref:Virus D5 protein-like n=1 Tax=Faunimonas pinastri TaxID=1855383 RepID=A0A1H9F868_9HYPH|nr:primase-like DNA-binding domain-containing protein [Faunimonas pinastri]SEQ34121.1 virus D5 protein-like [Faunimonas pinastri]